MTEELDIEVRDASRSNFTIIPNVIFDYGLSPYDIRLYCELKRIAGEGGKCWMNTENLAKRCNMSTGQISTSKNVLISSNLIVVNVRTHGNTRYHEITISDIWDINCEHALELRKEHARSLSEPTGSPPELAGSPGERINITINKNPDTARTKEEMMEMTRQSLRKFEEKHIVLPNLKSYPEDVLPIIEKVCDIWKLTVPPIKEDRGYWIRGARELMTACEGHPDVVLEEIKRDLDTRPARNRVIISSPNSLIQMARAKVGELKRKAESKTSIPRGASEVWIGGEKYTP